MLKMFRVTTKESELIRKKSIELNKKLLDAGKPPVQDSELLHVIIEKSVNRLHVKNGEIEIMNTLD